MSTNDFVVLKFGGTSVTDAAGWRTVASRIAACGKERTTAIVVHSALAGVSTLLETALAACLSGDHPALVEQIQQRHLALAAALGVDGDELLAEDFAKLTRLCSGIALIGEVTLKQHARVVALGELMANRLGQAYLNARGVDIASVDARDLLVSRRASEPDPTQHYLSAECFFEPDERARNHFDGADAFLVPGFIARDDAGDTVLLGRGGSDTTASYLAAKIRARRIEIWTDVAGMYSADPRLVPGARLLKRLDYSEAQEIATTGAKVLHPRCLGPARAHDIPMRVLSTAKPAAAGTLISNEPGSVSPRLKAISARKGLMLVSMETTGMWQEPGFLARAFAVFARHHVSIDLISSSETSVTVSLDALPAKLADRALARLVDELAGLCKVQVMDRCAAISLVGRQVRAILHELAPAFAVFKEYDIYLVSQAANDLNFTFVVDEKHSDRLVQRLHDLLIQRGAEDPVMGISWAESRAPTPPARESRRAWWADKRDELLALAPAAVPLYVYDTATLANAAKQLKNIGSVARLLYSIKANGHPDILRILAGHGLDFECVSLNELKHLRETLPELDPGQILFTPNFAPRAEYEAAFDQGVGITIDNRHLIEAWPAVFAGRELLMRVDPGQGKGHHRYVQTAGRNSKFGIPLHEVANTVQLAATLGTRIRGLHAHKGSGIVDASTWAKTANTLAQAAASLKGVEILNLGGGLGVPETLHGKRLSLEDLNTSLTQCRDQYPAYELWLEPGRFVVAEAGVILTRVTQCKRKDGVNFIGLNAGMNTLLRPALYGAYHEIVNLSRLEEAPTQLVDVVGPICESADVLGSGRMLPATREGDVVLITNAGAYGRVMSSHYNMRPPGDEVLL